MGVHSCEDIFPLLSPAEAYDFAAASYDAWHWQKVWRAVECKSIECEFRKNRKGFRILDIGCGTGTLLSNLAKMGGGNADLTGIDVSEGMLCEARKKLSNAAVTFIHADFLTTNIESNSFDIVFMCRVASHIENIKDCIKKISAIAKPGSIFIYSDVYSRHAYNHTRLPYGSCKIAVQTFKHHFTQIVKIAYDNSLILENIKSYSANNFPDSLKSDPALPHTLVDQLIVGRKMPFGIFMTFRQHSSRKV